MGRGGGTGSERLVPDIRLWLTMSGCHVVVCSQVLSACFAGHMIFIPRHSQQDLHCLTSVTIGITYTPAAATQLIRFNRTHAEPLFTCSRKDWNILSSNQSFVNTYSTINWPVVLTESFTECAVDCRWCVLQAKMHMKREVLPHPSRLIFRVRSSQRFFVSTKMMVLFSFSAMISSISWRSLSTKKQLSVQFQWGQPLKPEWPRSDFTGDVYPSGFSYLLSFSFSMQTSTICRMLWLALSSRAPMLIWIYSLKKSSASCRTSLGHVALHIRVCLSGWRREKTWEITPAIPRLYLKHHNSEFTTIIFDLIKQERQERFVNRTQSKALRAKE